VWKNKIIKMGICGERFPASILKILGVEHYMTVTDLARFLGMSGSNPLSIAI